MEVSSLVTVFLVFLPLFADTKEMKKAPEEQPDFVNSNSTSRDFGKVPVVKSIPDCPATFSYSPVCASDGVNYLNSAVFDCADRLAGGTLKLLHYGACQDYEVDEIQARGGGGGSLSYHRAYFSILLWSFFIRVLW